MELKEKAQAFAEEMLRVKNFVPAISIEGFEEATDSRRGDGTYQKIIRAMEILKAKKLPFGISCCYTSANAEVIGSEEYFDYMVELGAKFAWFFTYMPVGKGAVTDLIARPEAEAITISMPMAILNHVRLSIILIPISGKRHY